VFPLATAGVTIWALLQNLMHLSQPMQLADEPIYVAAGWRYWHGQQLPIDPSGVRITIDNFEHPPLAKYMFGLAETIAGHPTLGPARLTAALCTLATGAVLGLWLGRVAGRWTGLLAAALVTLLPTEVAGSEYRFGRYAMLDPVAELFATAAVAAAWYWFRLDGRRSWCWAGAAGVLAGLAASAKEYGFLGLVGPVLLGIALAVRDGRLLVSRLLQAGAAGSAALLTFVVLYLPLGNPLPRIKFLVQHQLLHSEVGHVIGFAGRVTTKPPWWTNLWFAGHSLGPVTVSVMLVGCASAIAFRRDRLVAWFGAALLVPFLFHCFLAHVVLPFYWTLWLPLALGPTAVGLAALVEWAGPGWQRLVAALLTAALLTATAGRAVADTWRVRHAHLTSTRQLPTVMARNRLHGAVLAGGMYSWEFVGLHLPGPVLYKVPPSLAGVDTVVLGRPRCRTPVNADVRALLAANPTGLSQVFADRSVVVYAVRGALIPPTPAQIATQPVWNLASNC
jgi:4-amino-4-deoxy-L-arabinose transferase-like glycosyltransferase